jgi:acyl dehydratase
MQSGAAVEFIDFPPITREQLRAYAEASGDNNPIHLNDDVAKAAGLSGVIAHGMITAGFIGERAELFIRDGFLEGRLLKLQTRFKAMTVPGDVISVGGTVKEISKGTVTLELAARNQRGDVTTTGVAVIG